MKVTMPKAHVGLVVAALMLIASGLHAEIPRQPANACKGQAELSPLQPLVLKTQKGDFRFKVEVADSETERNFGLMCRRGLAPEKGMLFDFGAPRPDAAFWMRNTLISLDIIYVRPNGTVLSIARNARPHDETPLPAGGPVQWVLEVAAGRAGEMGVLPGDSVISPVIRPR